MHSKSLLTEDQITQATEALYALVLADDDLSGFFEGMDVARIVQRQRQFLLFALNDEPLDAQVDLRRIHAPLLRRGLNHDHFDKLLQHLDTALAENQVSPQDRQAVFERMNATRSEILGETYTQFHSKEKTMTGRIGSMIYAIVCYTVGMASLAYTAGWLGGFLTPTQLDAASGQFSMTGVLINLCLVGLFAVQHSVMARPKFKAWWTQYVPAQCERSTYVLFSGLALIALMWFWQPLGIDIWRLDAHIAVVMWVVYACGWFVLVSATFFLNHFDLFGLRQAWLHLRGKAYTHIPFATPGYYRYVRHPIYVGWLLLIWATPTMTVSHLMFALLSTVYIICAIRWEERDLSHMLPEYEQYKEATPALIPGTKGKRPLPQPS